MAENDPHNVSAAFEMLLEEIEAEIDFVSKLAARASERHDFTAAIEANERADQATKLRDKLLDFRQVWQALMPTNRAKEQDALTREPQDGKQNVPKSPMTRHYTTRLERGQSTNQRAFNWPILQVLVESGGSETMHNVLTRVEYLMKDTLTELDYQPHASGELRWRTSAQWARNTMKERGFIKKGSPHGIWEITEAGREALKNGNV